MLEQGKQNPLQFPCNSAAVPLRAPLQIPLPMGGAKRPNAFVSLAF
jgi:hypothetical protein